MARTEVCAELQGLGSGEVTIQTVPTARTEVCAELRGLGSGEVTILGDSAKLVR